MSSILMARSQPSSLFNSNWHWPQEISATCFISFLFAQEAKINKLKTIIFSWCAVFKINTYCVDKITFLKIETICYKFYALDSNSLLIHDELNQEIKKLKNRKDALTNEINKDQKLIEKLQNIDSLEHYGRENYNLKKDNEDIFIVEYESDKE